MLNVEKTMIRILISLALSIVATIAHAQTWTQLQWGVNKSSGYPYSICMNISGSWSCIGSVNSGGVFSANASSMPAFTGGDVTSSAGSVILNAKPGGKSLAFTGTASQWPWQLNADGTWTLKQPTFADLAAGQVSIETAFSGQNFFAPAGQTAASNWLKTYAYGDNNTPVVVLNRANGGVAIAGAARSSDSTGGGVATIGVVGWGFTNGTAAKAGYPSWGGYFEARAYSSTTGYAQGAEFEIANGNASAIVQDPYNQYQPGGTNALIIGSGGACGVQFTITGAANNGSGAVRLTVNSVNNINSGQTVTTSGVGGVSGANGTFVVTVIDSTHIDLVSSTFSGAYTSGGSGTRGTPCYDPITGLTNMYAKAASSAIRISPNDGTFARGIVIGCGSFTGSDCTDGSSGGTALGMPIASSLDWFAPGNAKTFTIRSTAKSTELAGILQWSAGGLTVTNATTGNTLFQFYPGATSVNGVKLVSATTGNNSVVSAFGTDTNVGLTVQGQGTGLVNLVSPTFNSSTGYVYANGSGAATFSTTIPTTALSGFLQAAQEPAHTGDMTNTAGSLATAVNSIGGKSVTLGGAFTMSGAYGFTGTLTGTTSVTFPTSGTLATTSATTTINGTSCTLTSSCTVTAAAGTLTGSTLASGITDSSLTSVGTLTSLTVSGTVTVNANAFNMTSANSYQPQMTFFNQYNGSSAGYYIVQKGRGATGSGASAVQVGDFLGTFLFKGLDSNGSATNSSSSISAIVDAVAAGSVTSHLSFAGNATFDIGIAVGVPTGGYKGAGTINAAAAYYANGTAGVTCGSGLGGTSRTINGIVTTC